MSDVFEATPEEADETPETPVNEAELGKLLYKIEQSTDFQCLYALEEAFNKCGLSIQTTSNSRMILCKLRGGKPVTEQVIDDYIFVGSIQEKTKELSDRLVTKINDFVRTNAGAPSKVENLARVWRNGLRMYESVQVVNEDVNKIAGDLLVD